jgi:hypothetical protein
MFILDLRDAKYTMGIEKELKKNCSDTGLTQVNKSLGAHDAQAKHIFDASSGCGRIQRRVVLLHFIQPQQNYGLNN